MFFHKTKKDIINFHQKMTYLKQKVRGKCAVGIGMIEKCIIIQAGKPCSVPPQFKHTKMKQRTAADQFVTLLLFIFNMQIRFLFCTIEIKYTNRIDAKSKECEYS